MELVIIYVQSYICNFPGWDRYRLLDNDENDTYWQGGFTVSLKKKNAAIFNSVEQAMMAIQKFKLVKNRCVIELFAVAPNEL